MLICMYIKMMGITKNAKQPHIDQASKANFNKHEKFTHLDKITQQRHNQEYRIIQTQTEQTWKI